MKAIRSAPKLWQTNFMYNLKPRACDQIIRFKFPYVSDDEWNCSKSVFFPEISEKGKKVNPGLTLYQS